MKHFFMWALLIAGIVMVIHVVSHDLAQVAVSTRQLFDSVAGHYFNQQRKTPIADFLG